MTPQRKSKAQTKSKGKAGATSAIKSAQTSPLKASTAFLSKRASPKKDAQAAGHQRKDTLELSFRGDSFDQQSFKKDALNQTIKTEAFNQSLARDNNVQDPKKDNILDDTIKTTDYNNQSLRKEAKDVLNQSRGSDIFTKSIGQGRDVLSQTLKADFLGQSPKKGILDYQSVRREDFAKTIPVGDLNKGSLSARKSTPSKSAGARKSTRRGGKNQASQRSYKDGRPNSANKDVVVSIQLVSADNDSAVATEHYEHLKQGEKSGNRSLENDTLGDAKKIDQLFDDRESEKQISKRPSEVSFEQKSWRKQGGV